MNVIKINTTEIQDSLEVNEYTTFKYGDGLTHEEEDYEEEETLGDDSDECAD